MVPFHMIGARDVESAVLGGYAEHVRRMHPEAPVPGFYLGERLFEDAKAQRAHYGDEAFFARLNQRANADSGWGDLGACLGRRFVRVGDAGAAERRAAAAPGW